MDIPNLLATVAVGVTVATLAVGGIRYGNLKNLREELAQERLSKEELRKDRDDARQELADERHARTEDARKFEHQISQLRGDVETLRRTVTGEAHLVAMDGALHDLTEHVAALHADVLKIRDRLDQEGNP